jgi:hypothetical protein
VVRGGPRARVAVSGELQWENDMLQFVFRRRLIHTEVHESWCEITERNICDEKLGSLNLVTFLAIAAAA